MDELSFLFSIMAALQSVSLFALTRAASREKALGEKNRALGEALIGDEHFESPHEWSEEVEGRSHCSMTGAHDRYTVVVCRRCRIKNTTLLGNQRKLNKEGIYEGFSRSGERTTDNGCPYPEKTLDTSI